MPLLKKLFGVSVPAILEDYRDRIQKENLLDLAAELLDDDRLTIQQRLMVYETIF